MASMLQTPLAPLDSQKLENALQHINPSTLTDALKELLWDGSRAEYAIASKQPPLF